MVGLGVLSIVAFGSWFYGFGVLIEPIRADTGWTETVLTGTYGGSLLLTGLGAAVGGGIIDRRGGRSLFVTAAVVASASLAAASYARYPAAFAAMGALAGGTIGAAGYYHATQAVIGQVAPAARTRGMTGLTLWGAFASPVFLPALGAAVIAVGWRTTTRALAVAVGVAFAGAAWSLPRDTGPPVASPSRGALLAGLRRTSGIPAVRRLYTAGLAAGVGSTLLLLYQVPAMVAAGLSLATASSLAGARGVVQLAGRVPLPPVVRRVGAWRALRWSLLLAAAGAVILPAAGDLPTALAFTVVAGVAIGALAALEGIYAAEITDPDLLGTTLGAYSLVRGLGAALGPLAGGVLVDATGSRTVTLVAAAVMLVTAAAVLGRPPRPAQAGAGADIGRTPGQEAPTGP
jgi:MFS family permease